MTDEERQFVLGVDLDGVVAEFYGGIRPIAAEWLGVPLETLTPTPGYGLREWNLESMGTYEDLHRFAVTQRDLFRSLQPIPGAAAALRRLSQVGVRIRIITHRLYLKYFHEQAVQQTVAWLDHHGVPYWDLCFMKDKGAVGADLYVEDSPDNVRALRAGGHPTIVFENSTNVGLAKPRARTWGDVEASVREEMRRWNLGTGLIPSKNTKNAIKLDQAPLILQTTDAVLQPGSDSPGPPWIVAAAARALESPDTRISRQLVALAATGCPQVQGLSTWVAILGGGSSEALTRLRDLVDAAGLPVHLESAPLSEYPFVPFLVRERSVTSLLLPKGGGPGLNDWVLGMVDDISDITKVAAVSEMVAKRFSFRDFTAVPGGFEVEPLRQKRTP